MTSPLAGSLARAIGTAMRGLFLNATLTRETQTAGTNPWDAPTAGTPLTYPCKAIRDTFGASWLAGGLVAADDVRVLILAATLSTTPEPGDRITIGSQTWTIVPAGAGKPAVATDPATAVYELRCRK